MSDATGWAAHKVLGVTPAVPDFATKVLDRESGCYIKEKVPWKIAVQLGLLHRTWLGQLLARTRLLRWYFCWSSANLGRKYDSPDSRKLIPHFIREYAVDTSDIERPVCEYRTLNEFFARQLRPGARPIHRQREGRHAVQPADCRLHVFEGASEATRLWIKGRGFSVQQLLGSLADSMDLQGCSLAISRLAPQDYHRFHAPVGGEVVSIAHAGADLYSVKPVVVTSPLDVFDLNKRSILSIASPEFGRLAYVVIGALQVGSIQLDVAPGDQLAKGQEVGHFLYGGSTVITVFERGRIAYDTDLHQHSLKGAETLVRMGTSLGVAWP